MIVRILFGVGVDDARRDEDDELALGRVETRGFLKSSPMMGMWTQAGELADRLLLVVRKTRLRARSSRRGRTVTFRLHLARPESRGSDAVPPIDTATD